MFTINFDPFHFVSTLDFESNEGYPILKFKAGESPMIKKKKSQDTRYMLLPYRNTDGSFHQATEVDFYKFSSIKFRGWSLHAKFSSQHKDLVVQIIFSIT